MEKKFYIGIYWHSRCGYTVTHMQDPKAFAKQREVITGSLGYDHVSTITITNPRIYTRVFHFVKRLDPTLKREKITLADILREGAVDYEQRCIR